MKKIPMMLVLLLFACISYSQTNFLGKIYRAFIKETCKDGVGTLSIYKLLKFDENIVTIGYNVEAHVPLDKKALYENMYEHLTKTYKWKYRANRLSFKDCYDISNIKIVASTIEVYDKEWNTILVFKEL
jgi:hypothetical protein